MVSCERWGSGARLRDSFRTGAGLGAGGAGTVEAVDRASAVREELRAAWGWLRAGP